MDELDSKKLNDSAVEDVSGGFAGDWGEKDERNYWLCGIEHTPHAFSKDEYFYGGKKISKDLAYKMRKRAQHLIDSGKSKYDVGSIIREEFRNDLP